MAIRIIVRMPRTQDTVAILRLRVSWDRLKRAQFKIQRAGQAIPTMNLTENK